MNGHAGDGIPLLITPQLTSALFTSIWSVLFKISMSFVAICSSFI